MKTLQHDIVPKQVDIEVTSRCNLQCKLCPTLDGKAKAMDMPLSLFKSIIKRVNFPTTIVPWLNGEPMLHPEYPEMLKTLNDAHLRYYVTTNGMLFRQDAFMELLSPGTSCYQIIFSLDGTDCKTAAAARPGTDYETVSKSIKTAMEMNRDLGKHVDIAVKICERGQDYEEIERFIAKWLGVADYVCVGKPLNRLNEESMRKYPCRYSDPNFMVVKSDGRMTRCAYNFAATNDERYTMGRVDGEYEDVPLLDIYNNEKMRDFRTAQRNGIFPGPCATCGFAYTGDGFDGTLRFRNRSLVAVPLFYHDDYYNRFFSLTEKKKGGSWSGTYIRCRACKCIQRSGGEKCTLCGEAL
jgi:MoaA/NifB/PqqE/SkfB family radical SAM enzyme